MPPSAELCASTEWMKTLQSLKPMDVIFWWISCAIGFSIRVSHVLWCAHLLTVTRLAVLALRAVDEGGSFRVEAVEALGLLVDEGVVLRHELPADLGRIHRSSVSHGGGMSETRAPR